ncbi:hypothetical protein PENSPDRAFT_552953, partial [Peniophora sp. CONT]
GNRRHLDDAIKCDIVMLTAQIGPTLTAEYLEVGESTVYKVCRRARLDGAVSDQTIPRGRPRQLDALDMAYLESLIVRRPDMYLQELQAELEDSRGIHVHESTIERAL